MNLEHIEDICRSMGRGREKDAMKTLLALVRNMRGENATHNEGVRELLRARDVKTGRISVIFQGPDAARPQVMDAVVFDDRYQLLKDTPKGPVFHVHKSWSEAEDEKAPQWQCRSCRKLVDHEVERHQVRDDLERDLGEWCSDCVVARVPDKG